MASVPPEAKEHPSDEAHPCSQETPIDSPAFHPCLALQICPILQPSTQPMLALTEHLPGRGLKDNGDTKHFELNLPDSQTGQR